MQKFEHGSAAEIAQALKMVREAANGNVGFDFVESCGICHNYDQAVRKLRDLPYCTFAEDLADMMSQWPEYSGSASYPVPCPLGDPPAAYWFVSDRQQSMWVGEYGATRRRLLDFLIQRYEAMIPPVQPKPFVEMPVRDIGPFGALLGETA